MKVRHRKPEWKSFHPLDPTTPNMTHEEVGRILGVSRGRIAQLEDDALDKIYDGIVCDPVLREAWRMVTHAESELEGTT